jgi:hypothetical protein
LFAASLAPITTKVERRKKREDGEEEKSRMKQKEKKRFDLGKNV